MLRKFNLFAIVILSVIINQTVTAIGESPSSRFTVSGYIKDAENGEALIGATVSVNALKTATASNQYGFYSLSLAPSSYIVEFRYIGYQTVSKTIDLTKNVILTVELLPDQKQIGEVIITAERPDANVKKNEMSVAKLDMKTIKKIPAFMGEVDIIKVLQLLPGVLPTAEGTSGFSVRGGGMDQNLILLDEATVYNASHLMGFFSVFNNDAIRDVKLYKGDIPANFGGRLSSVLDVRMKEGNSKKLSASGGIGFISSRLTVEGPIVNEKTSFLISGRRTYIDKILFPLLPDTAIKKTTLYFYDLNMKVNHQFNNNNRLFLSAYAGRDKMGQKDNGNIEYGNMTGTLRWNHQYNSRLFSNLTATAAKYDYLLTMTIGDFEYVWKSEMRDYSLKLDYNYFLNPENEIKFGASTTYHYFDPCNLYQVGKDGTQSSEFPKAYALEHGVYISNDQKLGERLTLKYGLRFTLFQNIGKDSLYTYAPATPNYKVNSSTYYAKKEIYNSFNSFEPRFGLVFTLNSASSAKVSYSRTSQYMQLASNSAGMLLDIWFPSSPNVKPQKANQYAIGYFRNFSDNVFETSIEAYYKDMFDVIDFKDNAQLLQNPKLEREVRKGTAKAFGVEFLIRKNEGRLNGWISYTLSSTKRKVPEINKGKAYSAPYDKPNNVSIVLNYELTKRLTLSANWVYATGAPYTKPDGKYGTTGPVSYPIVDTNVGETYGKTYSSRNESRMPDYHRLDLSLTLKGKYRPRRPWQGEWVFSFYNVYGRHNTWILNFIEDSKNPGYYSAQNWYLPFLFFPGVTYNFNF